MLKIGIVSAYNPHIDKKAHSGILNKINNALENANCETIWIKNSTPLSYKILGKVAKLFNLIFKKNIYIDRTYVGSYLLASTINKKLIEKCDYIMVIHYFHVLYWLKTNKPIIYHSDATFEIIDDYYIFDLWNWNKKQAENIEKKVLNKATLHLSSSDWRNNSVINHYKISSSLCKVLEYGPCIDIEKIDIEKKETLQLLFLAVEWERKGGDIAVETCEILNELGIKTVINIVGIKEIPSSCVGKEFVNFVGYLNKNDLKQYQILQSILKTTDFLVLPTKAECSAVVYTECAAYGIPVITYDTGGVGNYVINGLNGYRLPLSSDAKDFANKIKEILDTNQFEKLSKGGLKIYKEKLNWNNWTKEFLIYFNKK